MELSVPNEVSMHSISVSLNDPDSSNSNTTTGRFTPLPIPPLTAAEIEAHSARFFYETPLKRNRDVSCNVACIAAVVAILGIVVWGTSRDKQTQMIGELMTLIGGGMSCVGCSLAVYLELRRSENIN